MRTIIAVTLSVFFMGATMAPARAGGFDPQWVGYGMKMLGSMNQHQYPRHHANQRFGHHPMYPRPRHDGRVYYNDPYPSYAVRGGKTSISAYSKRYHRETLRIGTTQGSNVGTSSAVDARARGQLARDVKAAFGPVPQGTNYAFAMTPSPNAAPRAGCRQARTAQSSDGAYTLVRWICPRGQ